MEHVIHSLNARQIMEMVQLGYNSLNPKDVQKYLKGVKPNISENMNFFYGSSGLKTNLGEGHINDSNDFGAIQNTFGTDPTAEFQYEEDEYTNFSDVLGPNAKRGNYTDISHKVRQRLEAKQLQKSSKLQELFEEEEEETFIPKRSQKRRITEQKITNKKKAHTAGYDLGVDYINEFIVLLKNPTTKQRRKVYEKMKEIFEAERLFHESVLPYYRGGVMKSEKALMEKIKKKQRNG